MCVRVFGTRIEAAWLVNAKTNRRDSHFLTEYCIRVCVCTIYAYAYVPCTIHAYLNCSGITATRTAPHQYQLDCQCTGDCGGPAHGAWSGTAVAGSTMWPHRHTHAHVEKQSKIKAVSRRRHFTVFGEQ